MKRPIAILMLAVYLFNLGGYSFVFRYFIHQSDRSFSQQLDQNQYNEADLVQISIPLHLPYIQNSGGSERIDGSIENNGVHYNYVKRRVTNDTLYIMCLPNDQKTLLVTGKSSYASEVYDFASNKKQKESSSKKIGISADYHNIIPQYRFASPTVDRDGLYDRLAYRLVTTDADLPEHPPKSAS